VLVRNIPVYHQWLEDGVNSYQANDLDDFDAKMVQIINNELPDLTQSGYQLAVARNLPAIGQQLKQVYETVLKG